MMSRRHNSGGKENEIPRLPPLQLTGVVGNENCGVDGVGLVCVASFWLSLERCVLTASNDWQFQHNSGPATFAACCIVV